METFVAVPPRSVVLIKFLNCQGLLRNIGIWSHIKVHVCEMLI